MDEKYPLGSREFLKLKYSTIIFSVLCKTFGTTVESDKWEAYAESYLKWAKKQSHAIVEALYNGQTRGPRLNRKTPSPEPVSNATGQTRYATEKQIGGLFAIARNTHPPYELHNIHTLLKAHGIDPKKESYLIPLSKYMAMCKIAGTPESVKQYG